MNGRRPQPPLRLVYFALITSTAIYAVIVWTLSRTWPPAAPLDEELRNPVVMMMMIAAMTTFAFALFFGTRVKNYVARWAIIESATIYGLLAAFIARDWRLFAIGWVLSLLAFALAPPPSREA